MFYIKTTQRTLSHKLMNSVSSQYYSKKITASNAFKQVTSAEVAAAR